MPIIFAPQSRIWQCRPFLLLSVYMLSSLGNINISMARLVNRIHNSVLAAFIAGTIVVLLLCRHTWLAGTLLDKSPWLRVAAKSWFSSRIPSGAPGEEDHGGGRCHPLGLPFRLIKYSHPRASLYPWPLVRAEGRRPRWGCCYSHNVLADFCEFACLDLWAVHQVFPTLCLARGTIYSVWWQEVYILCEKKTTW